MTTAEGRIRILSYPNFEPVLQTNHGAESGEFMLNGHTSSCLTAELQPTGRYLATGGSDSVVALWDTTDWICQRTITRMVGPVRSISRWSVLGGFLSFMLTVYLGFTFDGSFAVGGSDEGERLRYKGVQGYILTVRRNRS